MSCGRRPHVPRSEEVAREEVIACAKNGCQRCEAGMHACMVVDVARKMPPADALVVAGILVEFAASIALEAGLRS